MTFDRLRARALTLRRRPDLDDEARRAHEALRRLEQVPQDAASREWREIAGRRRRRRVRRAVVGTLLGLLVGGFGVAGWFGGRWGWNWLRHDTGFFAVQRVIVSGLDRITEAEVREVAGVGEGQDILALDPAAVEARLLALPLVRAATVTRDWRREVRVTLQERQPLAVVLLDRTWEIDADGVLLPPEENDSVVDRTIIRGVRADSARAGRRLAGSGLRRALTLMERLTDPTISMEASVSEIWAENPDSLIMILMKDALPVKVGRGDIPPRRLLAMRAAIQDLAAREIEAQYLDLRFTGQVVVMRKPPAPPETGNPKAPGASPAGADSRGRRTRHGRTT